MVLVQLELAPQSFNVELAHSSISINKAWIVFTKNGGKNQTKNFNTSAIHSIPSKTNGASACEARKGRRANGIHTAVIQCRIETLILDWKTKTQKETLVEISAIKNEQKVKKAGTYDHNRRWQLPNRGSYSFRSCSDKSKSWGCSCQFLWCTHWYLKEKKK